MSKKINCFKIGLRYKYAPETFYIMTLQPDGSYKNLDIDTLGNLWGYWLSLGEREKVVAEVKRFLRSREKKQSRLVTYGFYIKDSSIGYVYCSNPVNFAHEYNVVEKLTLYKGYKKHLLECGCKYYTGTTAKLNGKYEIENKQDEYDEIDLSRPVKIHVKKVRNKRCIPEKI